MRISVFKKVTEGHDFCPNYEGGTALLTFHDNISPPKQKKVFRVSVWGNDDFGMDKDFDSRIPARALYNKILALDTVDPIKLKAMGLEQF